MAVNWKAILSLFIIFAIIGLLIFTPKGQKIVGNRTAPVGSFIKSITGKITKPSSRTVESKELDIFITQVSPSSLGEIEIPVNGRDFEGRLNYDVVSVLGSSFDFDYKELDVKAGNLIGNINFLRNGNMKISGNTNSLKLNDMSIKNQDIDVLIVGEPIYYDIENIEKNELTFSYLSGSKPLFRVFCEACCIF